MSDPFIAEIRMFTGSFAPVGWALCNGQLLPISQNTALFSLLGVMYGGNGTTNFALPNLMGASPLGYGQGQGLTRREIGEMGGEATVTLLGSEMPAHTHPVGARAGNGNSGNPAGHVWAKAPDGRGTVARFVAADPTTPMHPEAIGLNGGNQPHNNRPPFLTVNFIIALEGIFPSRS